jgi:hypothetical protein
MARELLESNGIEARLRDEAIVGIHPWLSNAVGGVKLVVPSREAERARAILGDTNRSRPSPVEDADPAPERRSEADVLAARALNAAGIGLLMFPPVLQLWSAWLLLRVSTSSAPLGQSGRKHALTALAIDLLVFGAVAAIVFRIAIG